MGLEEILANLRKEYAPQIRASISALNEAMRVGDLAAALRIAHQLGGTAGSYGFKEVSNAARALEDSIEGKKGMDHALAELNRASSTVDS